MTESTTAMPSDADYRWLLDMDHEEFNAYCAELTPAQQVDLAEMIESIAPPPPPWEPLPHQIPPSGRWFGWLMMMGRNTGKSATITRYMNDHANGPPCFVGDIPHRMGIIAATHGDAFASIVNGKDGLMVINPDVRRGAMDGYSVVKWPNGSFAYIFGTNTADAVDRLRARTNRCLDVREEMATWRYLKDALAHSNLSLRGGPHPHWVGATTPKPRPSIRAMTTNPIVRVTKAKTSDNTKAPQEITQRFYDEFGNSPLGLQELEGEILEDVSGALWEQELIEQYKVGRDELPPLIRVRTYVDPSWGTTHDECGIIVAGLGRDRHCYILDDLSRRCAPDVWGKLAALGRVPTAEEMDRDELDENGEPTGKKIPPEPRTWHGHRSEKVVAEGNFQAEQVKITMKLMENELHQRFRFSLVYASKGKRIRAEPVQLLYTQGRVHHVGDLKGLEFQLTNWVPPEASEDTGDPGDPPISEGETAVPSKWSPDRLDALVWAVTDLMMSPGSGPASIEAATGRIPPTRPGQRSSGQSPSFGGIPMSTRQAQLTRQQLERRNQE